jgi:hypothetical protein
VIVPPLRNTPEFQLPAPVPPLPVTVTAPPPELIELENSMETPTLKPFP